MSKSCNFVATNFVPLYPKDPICFDWKDLILLGPFLGNNVTQSGLKALPIGIKSKIFLRLILFWLLLYIKNKKI